MTYNSRMRCSNCGRGGLFSIPKGTTKTQFEKTGECQHCGCKTLYSSEDI